MDNPFYKPTIASGGPPTQSAAQFAMPALPYLPHTPPRLARHPLALVVGLLLQGLASGTQASYGWLSAPHSPDGRVIEPAVAGVTDWLRRWHAGYRATLAARLPDAWQQRFPAWLDAQRG